MLLQRITIQNMMNLKTYRFLIVGGILLTSMLLWFAISNYRSAEPVAHSILQALSLSLGQGIEAVATKDPTLKLLSGFKSPDIAYFAVIDRNGLIRFHTNSGLSGEHVADKRYLSVVSAPIMHEERIRLGTGEVVFETHQQLHLPGETLILRLALHTWQADLLIRRARTGLTLLLGVTIASWVFGILAIRLQRRDIARREELGRREHLARLGEMGAVMAHEVRTPLAGIKGFAQLLGERLDDPRQKSYAASIVSESERLEDLVNDLLNYARPEPPPEGIVPLVSVLEEAFGSLAEEARQHGVTLELEAATNKPVTCHPDRLRQIFLNLFSNALQAMPEGGKIMADLSEESGMMKIVLSDNGPGFADEAIQRAFDPFYTSRASGSGLGLPICRKIVEGCGGTITAANWTSGAEITLRLPLAKELA